MSAHTPGAIRAANGILSAMETAFGVIFGEKRQEYLTACASKIDRETAAHELLEACKMALITFPCGREYDEARDIIRSAIAKAEGKT